MEKGKIKILYDKVENEIEIIADADGLRFLANICLRIIGITTPAGHWHLMKEMGTLE